MAKPKRKAKEPARIQLPAVIPAPPPEPEPSDLMGRPTKYKPEYARMAAKLCENGATDQQLAEFFDVNRSTIYDWQHAHPEFGEVLKLGKSMADDRVERSLYEQAIGYTMKVKKHVKLRDQYGNEKLQEVIEEVFVPPSEQAARFFLKNRRPDVWKDKTEQHVSGTVEHEHLTLEQKRERVTAMLKNLRQKQLGTSDEAGG